MCDRLRKVSIYKPPIIGFLPVFFTQGSSEFDSLFGKFSLDSSPSIVEEKKCLIHPFRNQTQLT